MVARIARLLGFDTAGEKYAHGRDERFSYVSESFVADTWTRTTSKYCSVVRHADRDEGRRDSGGAGQSRSSCNYADAACLYFDFSSAIWLLNGTLGRFIMEAFRLSPAQMGLTIAVPTVAGSLMRFSLGLISQYPGRQQHGRLCLSGRAAGWNVGSPRSSLGRSGSGSRNTLRERQDGAMDLRRHVAYDR